MIFASVLLPDPLGPMRPWIWPRFTRRNIHFAQHLGPLAVAEVDAAALDDRFADAPPPIAVAGTLLCEGSALASLVRARQGSPAERRRS